MSCPTRVEEKSQFDVQQCWNAESLVFVEFPKSRAFHSAFQCCVASRLSERCWKSVVNVPVNLPFLVHLMTKHSGSRGSQLLGCCA